MSLASHVDKFRSLDSYLAEHDIIKQDACSLRELLDEEKRDLDQIRGGRHRAEPRQQHQPEDEDGNLQHDDNDNDAHRVATVTAHGLERVEEEHEEQLAVEEDEQSHRRDELTGPRTPEPTGLGMDDEDDKTRSRSRSPSPRQLHLRAPSLHTKTLTLAWPHCPTSSGLPLSYPNHYTQLHRTQFHSLKRKSTCYLTHLRSRLSAPLPPAFSLP